MAEKECEI
jgi:hypothetical protein